MTRDEVTAALVVEDLMEHCTVLQIRGRPWVFVKRGYQERVRGLLGRGASVLPASSLEAFVAKRNGAASMTNGHDWIAQHPELAAIIPVARKAQPARTTKPPPKREPLPMPVREGDVVTLYLALPPAQLRSNGRAHHMVKAKLVKDCREAAGLLAKIVAPPKPWAKARIDVESWSARKQDPTNFWHGLKAYIDGCEDGGLFVTDADVEQGEVVQHIDGKRDGKRQVTLTITRTA